jgi:hypothetical protein
MLGVKDERQSDEEEGKQRRGQQTPKVCVWAISVIAIILTKLFGVM